jgi:hypothetical protein
MRSAMLALMITICSIFVGGSVSAHGSSQTHSVTGICYADRTDLVHVHPGQTYKYTHHMENHEGEKCWHVVEKNKPQYPIVEFKPISEEELFNQFINWQNSRHAGSPYRGDCNDPRYPTGR